uniref:Uncharacterized protein n=2 Tax=Setaria TaxID=4554 RepID=K4AHA8_SETIT|nr:hypothetical protein SEVIR_9G058250v2 [Setaria viridis]
MAVARAPTRAAPARRFLYLLIADGNDGHTLHNIGTSPHPHGPPPPPPMAVVTAVEATRAAGDGEMQMVRRASRCYQYPTNFSYCWAY